MAPDGRYSEHFRWLLGRLVKELEWLDGRVGELDARLGERMQEHGELIGRLCTIPGLDRLTAWALIAELGVDMNQFPDAAHVASWAGLCPGNQESAGKRFSGRTRKGDRYLRRLLVQNAWAVAHRKGCFLTAVFYRVARRRGAKKAAIAVAHRILVLAYQIIRDGSEYHEVGGDYFDRLNPERTVARLRRRLEQIGYDVDLRPRQELAPPRAEPGERRRGRPCLCASRGIPCTHAPTSQPASSTEWRCRKCEKWGIACIHVRNQKLHGPDLNSATE